MSYLTDPLCLKDYPFWPEAGRYAAPDQPLDILASGEKYFVKLGAFQEAMEQVQRFVENDCEVAILAGRPPAILIQGLPGSGTSSLASYAALRLKEKCIALAKPGLSFGRIERVKSEDPARLLDTILEKILKHLKDNGVNYKASLEDFLTTDGRLIFPDPPVQATLEKVFTRLVDLVDAKLPLLILSIGEITWNRRSWMTALRLALDGFPVAFIFLTGHPNVPAIFKAGEANSPSLAVSVHPFTAADGASLIEGRIKDLDLRPAKCGQPKGIFPYAAGVPAYLLPTQSSGHSGQKSPDREIKSFVRFCHLALRNKEKRMSLPNPPSPEITEKDIEEVVRGYGNN